MLAICDALERWLASPLSPQTLEQLNARATAGQRATSGQHPRLPRRAKSRSSDQISRIGAESGCRGVSIWAGRGLWMARFGWIGVNFWAVRSAPLSRNLRTRPILSLVAFSTCKAQVERGGEFEKRVHRAPRSCFLARCSSRVSLLEY